MNNNTDEQISDSPSPAFGDLLRQAREERGITIEQLSDYTRISRQHIRDLEDNDSSGIASIGYVRGYLRTLAKYLAIDADEVVSAFETASSQEARKSALEEYIEPRNIGTSNLTKVLFFVVLGVLVVAVGTAIMYWFLVIRNEGQIDSPSNAALSQKESQEVSNRTPSSADSDSMIPQFGGSSDEDSDDSVKDALEEFLSSREDSTEETSNPSGWEEDFPLQDLDDGIPLGLLPNDEQLATEPNSDTQLELTPDDSEEVDQEEVGQEDEEAEDTPALVFEFEEDSWLVVQDSQGNILVNGLQRADNTLTLDGEEPFSIRIGDARGVSLEFRGESISLDPYMSERGHQAQLTLPQ